MRGKLTAVLGAVALLAALALPAAISAAGLPLPAERIELPASEQLPALERGEKAGDTAKEGARKVGDELSRRAGDTAKAAEALGRDAGSRAAPATSRKRTAAAGGVDIRDFKYQPRTITISVGDTVTWTNSDQAPHDAKAFDGSFSTAVLEQGQSDSVTFDQPGSFRYFCSIHPPEQFPNFTGTVEVAAAGGGGASDGGGDRPADSGAADGGRGNSQPDATTAAAAGSVASAGARSAGGGRLADTGYEPWTPALVAALMIAFGTGILRLSDRRA